MNQKAIAILEVVGMPCEGGIITLAPGKTLALPSLEGKTVRCLAGALWLTRAGGAEDIVLEAGQNHAMEGRGKVVISAFEGGKLHIL